MALSVVDLFSDLAELIMWHLFPPQWAAPLIHTYISPLVFAFKPVYLRTSLVAQTVKNLPAVQETWVQSLGREDPLEKEMATQSRYSGLQNPMERGAWQAVVHGVPKSQTRLSN